MKIINESVGNGDNHGCPFKHYDENNLRAKMRQQNVSSGNISEIIKLVSDKHYQVACKKYFSVTHNNYDSEAVGNHPNGYFDASMKYYAALDNQHVKAEIKAESNSQSSANTTKNNSQPNDTDITQQ